MPSVITYSLFLLADLAIIGVIIHFGYSTLTLPGSIAIEEFAARGQSSFPKKYDKQKTFAYYTAAMISFGLAVYGALVFLFSWMPHHWVSYDDDGDPTWMAATLAGTVAVFGAFALPQFLTKVQGKFLEFHRLQLRQAKADAFDELLNYELRQFHLMLQHSGLDTDVPARIEREIDKAQKGYTIFVEDAEVCRDLLNIFRKARGAPLPAKSL